ncbi:MAG: hydrolase [Desulfobacteraceae bacterium]|nr:MAG: hydrolase [Desulfobacteraceae bacterium]
MLHKGDKIVTRKLKRSHILVALLLILSVWGCGGKVIVSPTSRPAVPERGLARMGYSIQVGAFSNLDNAVKLSESLKSHGLNAYYFVHKTGLYKVRFGDFTSKENARGKAESLLAAGIIDEYYIVSPDDYAVIKQRKYGRRYLRDEIVKTAERFIGLPYRWGGSSSDYGFDCSGLSMTVYHLNGLNLPRSSKEQYRAGIPVKRSQLLRGDLVFFTISRGRKVSHVGIYTCDDKFIHAPGRGKRVRIDSLSNRYFKTRYVGARTYL